MKKTPLQLSILATLSYSSIFEYPLTLNQLFDRLLGPFPQLTLQKLKKELSQNPEVIRYASYYALKLDKNHFRVRQKRAKYATVKEHEVTLLQKIIKRLPTVTSAYITGSQAVYNPRSMADDIDVLVVTTPNTLWITRLCIVVWTTLIGKYRLHGRSGEYGWCFNLWLDRNHLTIPQKQRSLYTAFEVVQARLFFGAQNELILSNPWINEYINYSSKTTNTKTYAALTKPDRLSLSIGLFKLVEPLAFIVQTLYMRPKKTTERVSRHFAFFHPRDTSGLILKAWRKKMLKAGMSEREVERMELLFAGK